MKKIIILLLIFSFFMDFSFLPNLFSEKFWFPYFILALLTIVYLFSKNYKSDIILGIIVGVFLNILIPFNLVWYGVVVLIIWIIIYYLRIIFFSKELNWAKGSITFLIIFFFFNLVLVSEKVLIKTKETTPPQSVGWNIFLIKFLIAIIIFNIVFKLWPKKENNIKVLK